MWVSHACRCGLCGTRGTAAALKLYYKKFFKFVRCVCVILLPSVSSDIYQAVVGQSSVVDRQLVRLQELVEREVDYQQDLLEVLGMLDTLFATSLPRKEVPCPGSSRPNGLAEGSLGAPGPQLQAA